MCGLVVVVVVVVGVDYRERPPQLMSAETEIQTDDAAFLYFRRTEPTDDDDDGPS